MKRILLSILFIPHFAFAGTMGITQIGGEWAQVVTISAGPSWIRGGKTQTLSLEPQLQKTYTVERNTNVIPQGELFYGLQHKVFDKFCGQIGLAIGALGNAWISGDVWEDANPNFNNYSYSYKVNHSHLLLKGKLLTEVKYQVQPYFTAGAGVGLNNAHSFKIVPKLYEEVPAPPFSSKRTAAFTYSLGLGMQRPIDSNWIVGFGYEAVIWGHSQLGRAPGQTIGHGPSSNRLFSNELQLNISYIA